MAKQPAPSGYVFYEGLSMLTGTPIVAIATMHSDNGKTGNMIQTWILVQDRDPLAANRSGADIAICGKCPARGNCARGKARAREKALVLRRSRAWAVGHLDGMA